MQNRISKTLQFIGILSVLFACTAPIAHVDRRGNRFHSSADALAGITPSLIHGPKLAEKAFDSLLPPTDAHAELCDNDGEHPKFPQDADAITKAFCQDLVPGGVIPTPQSLAELQKLLGLDFKTRDGANASGGNPGFAFIGHSSSLIARFVSSINPRAIVFTPAPADGSKPVGYAVLAFTRGEHFVEVAVHDPTLDKVNFYLVLFDQDCISAVGGCTLGDLLTPRLETGWKNVRVYESSTALNNTVGDCKQCHQPKEDGPAILRMQEIVPPFTHFFSSATEGGRALLEDFHKAHGTTEDYGPIPAAMIDKADPGKLRDLIVAAGFGDQPNAFNSALIEAEVQKSAPLQPGINIPGGKSLTWQNNFDQFPGQFIAPPYHDVKVTDPTKLARMTDAYSKAISGKLAIKDLPDIRDVFLDAGLRDMGFAPKAGLDGNGLIAQMCQQCHNPLLDQTLSRARFNAKNLDQMDRNEKDLAIRRLMQPDESELKMPPILFRTITDDERDLMIAQLKK